MHFFYEILPIKMKRGRVFFNTVSPLPVSIPYCHILHTLYFTYKHVFEDLFLQGYT